MQTITTTALLHGTWHRQPGCPLHHRYTARLDGRRIVVQDEHGRAVEVRYGGTSDNRTVYAEVPGVGLIGGWQYPHRSLPWRALVDSINRQRFYAKMADLPKRSTGKSVTCPHCGGVFDA